MFQRFSVFLLVAMTMVTLPLWAQQPCPSFFVAVNSAEDQLMLAINGADSPQDQLAALDKFVQDHPDSKFMPCVNEYYASVNLKLKDYDKSIEYAEKDLAANYQDLNLLFSLMRAYASSTKVSDTIFDVIDNKVPAQAKAETGNPMRPAKATDEEWAKIQKESQDLAKDGHDYAVWAFFQILPRVTDPAKQVQVLDAFLKSYPDVEKDNAIQVNTIYFQDYQRQGNLDKTVEYGDKVIAADPNNVAALNTMALIYAFYLPHPSLDKAADYARKVLAAAPGMKKPEGVDDAAFKKDQANQLGMANMTLGYIALKRAEKAGGKLSPAIDELKAASAQLEGNPALQGQALYYLATAYEMGTPAYHRGAIDALIKATNLPGPMQGPARDLLAKVRAAVR
jgi:tetratricopeptide (TPR) repeat protein